MARTLAEMIRRETTGVGDGSSALIAILAADIKALREAADEYIMAIENSAEEEPEYGEVLAMLRLAEARENLDKALAATDPNRVIGE